MFRRIVAVFSGLSLLASASDLKYSKKLKDASGDHAAMTLYFQGQRIRIDHRNEVGYGWKDGRPETIAYGPRVATIYQCDMHRVLELDFDHHQYTATELDRNGIPVDTQVDPPKVRHSGVKVKVVVETRDTGETKQIFGQTAHHFVTTRKEEPAAGACTSAGESVEDGWYLDLEQPQDSCAQLPKPTAGVRVATLVASGGCIDDYEVQHVGPQLLPFPVEVTTTSNVARNKSVSSGFVVSELSRLPLDPQIFDLPTGYKHVDELDQSPSLPWLLRGRLMWQSVKSTVWGWTPWGR